MTASARDRLALAVLLFHKGGPWGQAQRELWQSLTGDQEATTRSLCNLAREACREAGRETE